ncbi:MAG: phosphoribosylamine--glycine ligase [Pseudomonadota bacterium]
MAPRILIVGGGGREHAMAWQCAQTAGEVLVAPGNAGTAREPRVRNVAVNADDIDALIALATRESIDLTIVGPEQPLVAGIVDRFHAAGLACFGPTAQASQLEGSKAFSKAFLARHNIPTASHAVFTDFTEAEQHIRTRGAPCVIKADGLAAGKGVVIADTVETACDAARDMLVDNQFGSASSRIVVEDFLQGEEASFIAITDGRTLLSLATSQDHKARDEGDQGPNTGGMGAYSPAPVVTEAVQQHVVDDIMLPTLRGLADDGIDYCGFLYAGLMIDTDGCASVLEFNCRLGDPETQPILRRLQTPLHTLCRAALEGSLADVDTAWEDGAALGVVLASAGYPQSSRTGDVIDGLQRAASKQGIKVFHAGTRSDAAGRALVSGGRVLCVTALGPSVQAAADSAYDAAQLIEWPGRFMRRDIGHRAIARERNDD